MPPPEATRARPALLRPRALLRFTLVGALLYFALFFVSVQTRLLFRLETAFARAAVWAMDAAGPPTLQRRVEVRQSPRSTVQLEYLYRVSVAGKEHSLGARYHLHAHNFLLFAALVLALPRVALRPRLALLVTGLIGVGLLNAVFVMGDLWRVEYLHMEAVRAANTFGLAPWIAEHLHRFHPTGSVFFAPIFILGFFLLLWPLEARPPERLPVARRKAGARS